MLVKLLPCDGDFDRTLRRRQLLKLGLLMVGLVGLVCYFLLVRGSALGDFAQGFYLGAAGGVILAALLGLIRTQYLLTHPDARKQARIRENDERARTISRSAFSFAGAFTFFVSAAALFVLLPLNAGAFFALLMSMAVYWLALLAASLWLSRRL